MRDSPAKPSSLPRYTCAQIKLIVINSFLHHRGASQGHRHSERKEGGRERESEGEIDDTEHKKSGEETHQTNRYSDSNREAVCCGEVKRLNVFKGV